jgi:hypothetical protein
MPLCKCYFDWLNIVQVRILLVNTLLPVLLLKLITLSQKMSAVEKCYFVQKVNTFYTCSLMFKLD